MNVRNRVKRIEDELSKKHTTYIYSIVFEGVLPSKEEEEIALSKAKELRSKYNVNPIITYVPYGHEDLIHKPSNDT